MSEKGRSGVRLDVIAIAIAVLFVLGLEGYAVFSQK